MAIGIIFIYLTPGYAPNLMSYLFGSIITVTVSDLWLMASLTLVVILVFIFLYRIVITSYSIHYTKLYDIRTAMLGQSNNSPTGSQQ